MFCKNNEKLKRLEAEGKLADALEKIESLRVNRLEFAKVEGALQDARAEKSKLCAKIEELNGKIREQSEADLVLASLRVVKAVVIDEKKKEDPYLRALMEQQRDAMARGQMGGGAFGQLGSMMDVFMRPR